MAIRGSPAHRNEPPTVNSAGANQAPLVVFEQLEPRLLLGANPSGMHPVNSMAEPFDGQIDAAMAAVVVSAPIYDDFSDGVLDPLWAVEFQNATGWTCSESGTDLTVEGITPAGPGWAKGLLTRTFSFLDDFEVGMDFSWNEPSPTAMQDLYVRLLDGDGGKVAYCGFRDAWTDGGGTQHAWVAGSGKCYRPRDELPLAGSASVAISRTGQEVAIAWDGQTIWTGLASTPVAGVSIEFGDYQHWGTPFGAESVDLITVAGKAKETFSAEANPTGDPIGGGDGYRRLVKRRDYHVSNSAELLDALKKAEAGEVIYVKDKARIDLSGNQNIVIPGGVTLASGRGRNTSEGALLYSTQLETFPLFIAGGPNVRVTGLRLRGPDPDRRTEQMQQLAAEGAYYSIPNSRGIQSAYAGLEVDNCELWGWSHAAVLLRPGATKAHIHHNYIHHNQRQGLGYGVCLDRADALIEANIFAYCRHAVAGTGAPGTSYEACYNIVRPEDGNSHSFDMHGGLARNDDTDIAGDWISIHHNTFEATNVLAVLIAGQPAQKAEIHHNWFLHADPCEAVLQRDATGNMDVYSNQYGLDRIIMDTEK
ncbi:MAG: LEPR-XLL domain-containing protein [Planctomycetota bacterium]|jgi:hypothetical protein